MINVVFYLNNDNYIGFSVEGHSGYSNSGSDIVCAGVSSAVMLSINIISDGLKVKNKINIEENSVYFKIDENDITSFTIINSLYKHLIEIQNDFKKFISVKISEV